MVRRIAYRGAKFVIAYARDAAGSCPGGEFFDRLELRDQAKLMALFKIAGDLGQFSNPEKFGDLGDGVYEFKSFQIRMPFVYCSILRKTIVITHGFVKKKDKAPPAEIERARRIRSQDFERLGRDMEKGDK